MRAFKLSPSSVMSFKRCAKCFWLEKIAKNKPPRGIFPSLPSGMDRIIKVYMDEHRAEGILPNELDLPGYKLFPDQNKLNAWRNWRSGLTGKLSGGQGTLIGAFDDLLVSPEGLYVPFDYKTKGTPAEDGYAAKYYQIQVDLYALMLISNGLKADDHAIFSYWSPTKVEGGINNYSPGKVGYMGGMVQFNTQTIKISLDLSGAVKIVAAALACLNGKEPDPSPDCELCAYVNKRQPVAQ